jgi:uncharacterized protein YbjT (DUF2867 family)
MIAAGPEALEASSSTAMRILVTGASGFVGASLLPALLDKGHEVRALARDSSRVEAAIELTRGQAGARDDDRDDDDGGGPSLDDFELVLGDVLDPRSLRRAMDGVEVAYYLIHSMEPPIDSGERLALVPDSRDGPPSSASRFAVRERLSAEGFATAARAAGVRRIVYLGGLQPAGEEPSIHLASRRAVERILLAATEDSLALRASIVIGARSRSFRLLVRLIERLPILALPAWRRFRTRPIDERDVIAMLSCAATVGAVEPRSLDIGGPETLTYGEIVKRIAELMLLDRPSIDLGVNATPIAARLAAVLAGETPELTVPLMESLTCDLLPADHHASEQLGVELHSFDSSVEHALREWEKVEPLAAR